MISKIIFNCDYEEIEKLIKKFEYNSEFISKLINTEDCRKNTPLFLCIYLRESLKIEDKKRRDILNIIKLLIKYHVKIRIRNEDKRTPLEEAISNVINYQII